MVLSILRRLIDRDRAEGGVRRVAGGRIGLSGFPRAFRETSWLMDAPPALVRAAGAVAIPYRRSNRAGRGRQAAERGGGGVFGADGAIIEPERHGHGDVAGPSAAELAAATAAAVRHAAPSDGPYVYAGLAFMHFGHFLLETISRFWWLDEVADPSSVRLVFHRGRDDSGATDFLSLPHVAATLAALGFDAEKALFVADRPAVFEELLVPGPAVALGERMHPAGLAAYDRIAERLASGAPAPHRALYLSRTRVRAQRRRADGEEAIEAEMARLGLEIVHPQELAFAEQIRTVRDARLLVGCDGSAMHLAAFAGPGTTVLSFDTATNRNQLMIEHARGLAARHVWFGGERRRRRGAEPRPLDVALARRHVQEMLQAPG